MRAAIPALLVLAAAFGCGSRASHSANALSSTHRAVVGPEPRPVPTREEITHWMVEDPDFARITAVVVDRSLPMEPRLVAIETLVIAYQARREPDGEEALRAAFAWMADDDRRAITEAMAEPLVALLERMGDQWEPLRVADFVAEHLEEMTPETRERVCERVVAWAAAEPSTRLDLVVLRFARDSGRLARLLTLLTAQSTNGLLMEMARLVTRHGDERLQAEASRVYVAIAHEMQSDAHKSWLRSLIERRLEDAGQWDRLANRAYMDRLVSLNWERRLELLESALTSLRDDPAIREVLRELAARR